jgi:hypothetical protein
MCLSDLLLHEYQRNVIAIELVVSCDGLARMPLWPRSNLPAASCTLRVCVHRRIHSDCVFLVVFVAFFFMFLLFVLFVQESPPTASPCTYSSPVRVALCGSIGNTHDFTIGFSFLGTLV